ncbi:MAG: hypothetical protein Q9178_007296 [Gyalolechia marmorata]
MSSETITLYDIPSKPPNKSWSPNSWKVRLILNYKKIPYTTHWLEYPDIAPHHTALGIPPNQPSETSLVPTPYTLPTIRIPTSLLTHSNESGKDDKDKDRYIMDSTLIATELEKMYPDPPLYLNSEEQQRIQQIWGSILKVIGPTLLPKVVRILNERSVPYFVETREKAFGAKLQVLEKEEVQEKAWREVRPLIRELGEVVGGKGGPFVRGEEVSYGDFVVVAGMRFLERCGEGALGRFLEGEEEGGKLGALYEASKVWLERET